MKKKKTRIQINDLDVNLEELKKISPEVLAKIRGGGYIIGGSFNCVTYSRPGVAGGVLTWNRACVPGGPYGW